MLVAYFDGASQGNPGQAGIGGLLMDTQTGKVLWEMSKSIGHKTNNEAEYLALIEVLKHLAETSTRNVVIRGDSQLVINQINGDWRVKEQHLYPLCIQAQDLIVESAPVRLEWVPREQNKQADRLSNQAFNQAENQLEFDPSKLEHLVGAIYVAHGIKDYAVDIENKACTCPAFQNRKQCKHLKALEGVI